MSRRQFIQQLIAAVLGTLLGTTIGLYLYNKLKPAPRKPIHQGGILHQIQTYGNKAEYRQISMKELEKAVGDMLYHKPPTNVWVIHHGRITELN